MSNPLAVYLHDHLAGSTFAIDLLESLRDYHSGEALGHFASGLLIEVEHDRNVLRQVTDRMGHESSRLKEAGAWLGEKVSRWKLSHDDPQGLGAFQALETLALGTLGKLALWRALAVIAETDDRLRDIDLKTLMSRAQEQHAQLEEKRLLLARTALSTPPAAESRPKTDH